MHDAESATGAVRPSSGQPASQWQTLIIDDADATISLGTSVAACSAGVLLLDDSQGQPTQSTAGVDLTALMDETVIESASGASAAQGSASYTRGTRFHEAVGRGLHVLDVLGRGGMGVAFRARQQDLARDVAIKVLHGGGRQAGPSEALHREARLTADLDHPGVIPIHQAGLDFFCMRLVRGRTLRSLCADRPLEGESLIRFIGHLARLAEAVAFAHHRGIIHRDIKPGNVMVGEHDEVLLLDWGLALRGETIDGRWHSDELAQRGACAGTPQYLPPETACGHREVIGPPSDVFLLGALLYQALSGRPPYRGESVRQVLLSAATNDWTPVSRLVPQAPPALVALQEQAMAADPGARPEAAAVAAGLRTWLHERQVARRADEALAAAHRVLAALPPPQAAADASQVYAECDRAWRHCQAAEALVGSGAAVALVMQDVALVQGRQALASGDLGLARVCADRVMADETDGQMAALRSAVAQAEARRHRARRRLRLMVVAALLLVGAGLLSLIIGTRYALDSEARLSAQRQAMAKDLLAQAQGSEDLAERHLLLHQALGYDEDNAQVRTLLIQTTLEMGWQSLASGDLISAGHLAESVTALAEDAAADLAIAIAVAIREQGAQRQAELERRHAILQAVADDSLMVIDEALVTQVAGWDGNEHLPAFSALIGHQRAAVRQFVIQVLARRKEGWQAERILLQASNDPDHEVRLAAWRVLGQHDLPLSAEDMVTALTILDGGPSHHLPGPVSRSHAVLLGTRQRQALAAAGHAAHQAGDHRQALGLLLWAYRPEEAIELVVDHLSDDAEALAQAVRLAWWHLHDPERAAALAASLRQHHPEVWDGWHVGWHQALARGDLDQVRTEVEAAGAVLAGDPRLVVWQALVGDPQAEQRLGRSLAMMTRAFCSAQVLAKRVVQERVDRHGLMRAARDRLYLESVAEEGHLALLHEVYAALWHRRFQATRHLLAVLAEYHSEDEAVLCLHHRVLANGDHAAAPLFAAHAEHLTRLITAGASP